MRLRKCLFTIIVVLACSASVFGTWALIKLDELIRESDLIVVGTLHDATEDSRGIGRGYIAVERIISPGAMTRESRSLVPGDNLKLTWADDWACAAGMHRGRIGKSGIWLLEVKDDGTVTAGYPGRFLDTDELAKVIDLLR